MSQVPLAPPPPTGQPIDSWLYLLWKRLTATGQLLWSGLSFTGSNLTDIETRNHNDLQNLDAGDYKHLTAANYTDLTDGGQTTLHTHTKLVTNSAATYTVLADDKTIVQTTAASVYTLPTAASFTGRELLITSQFAGTVTSNSSDVVPLGGGAAGTAILAATAGKWALLQSDATNWIVVAAN